MNLPEHDIDSYTFLVHVMLSELNSQKCALNDRRERIIITIYNRNICSPYQEIHSFNQALSIVGKLKKSYSIFS